MRSPIAVVAERSIAASPEAVWTVIADPAMHPCLDQRVELESASGVLGQPESTYQLNVRASARSIVRLEYVIVEAERPARLVAEVARGGKKKSAEQRAEIYPEGDGARIRWTVLLWTGVLTRRLAKASCESELVTWLDGVEREAVRASLDWSTGADQAYWDPVPWVPRLVGQRLTPVSLPIRATDDAFNGKWAERNWRNVPGPFYGAMTDNCWVGRLSAPNHVLYGDDDEYEQEFLYRQPRDLHQLLQVLDGIQQDTWAGWACDGDQHWTPDLVREWWRDRDRVHEWIHKKLAEWSRLDAGEQEKEAAHGLRDYQGYLDGQLLEHLRAYAFWLEHGRAAENGEALPDPLIPGPANARSPSIGSSSKDLLAKGCCPRRVSGCWHDHLMPQLALIIRHQTLPGRRDDVRQVWEAHMAPAVAGNPGHVAYFYCFDNTDPDAISAFQVYDGVESSQQFLETEAYAGYLREVEPLLSGPPQVTALTPVWAKQM